MMVSSVHHPVVSLLAFIDDEFDDSIVEDLRQLVSDLGGSREGWVIGPPTVVDEVDDAGIRTTGLVHHVFSAHDEGGRLLDEGTDRQLLDEVRTIVSGLERLSRTAGVDFGLELDGGSVGWIEGGSVSDDLRIGLLESWAARFA